MRIIGLTGGIASGKSRVARLLENLGASVIDADLLAREAVIPGTGAYSEILEQFGADVLDINKLIDRKRLGDIVFRDPVAKQRLEAIVHPAIKHLAEERLAALRSNGTRVAVYMAALLIEAGVTDRVDEIWVVYADEESQLDRQMKRDGCSREDAACRIASQMPMDRKLRFGKEVIDNSGSWEETERQVRIAWEREMGTRVNGQGSIQKP